MMDVHTVLGLLEFSQESLRKVFDAFQDSVQPEQNDTMEERIQLSPQVVQTTHLQPLAKANWQPMSANLVVMPHW